MVKINFSNATEVEEKLKHNFSKQGKSNRASGARFELKVRKDLEEQGWIIAKWTNNIDLDSKKIIPAKRKYNPFLKALSIGTGMPDFIGIRVNEKGKNDLMAIEVKKNGYLSKEEKEKCRVYLEKRIFPKILIAKAVMDGRNINIEYLDFVEKYKKNDK